MQKKISEKNENISKTNFKNFKKYLFQKKFNNKFLNKNFKQKKMLKMVKNGQKWSKMVKNGQTGQNGLK